MVSSYTFEREAINFIKEHGFDRFFIYGIKRRFITEDEVIEYAQRILDELAFNEDYEDCALLLREMSDYSERKSRGFSLLDK